MKTHKLASNIVASVFIIFMLTILFTLLGPNKLEAQNMNLVNTQFQIETKTTVNTINPFSSVERIATPYTATLLSSFQDLVMTGYDNVVAFITSVHDYIYDILSGIQLDIPSNISNSRGTASVITSSTAARP